MSISIDALVRELRNQGHSVHVFAPRFRGHDESDPNTIRFRALETPWSKGHPIAYPPYWRKLRRFRQQEFDVIHTHTPYMLGFVGLRWAESHEIPIVSTYHTLYDRYAHYMAAFPRRYIRFRIAKHTQFYFNSVQEVITPSEAAKRWLIRHGVERPITVVPTGISSRKLIDRAEARASLGIPPDQRIMLYVGRLAKEKNLGTLLETAKIVTTEDSRARLWIVGDGPFKEQCLQIAAKNGLGDRVRFVGSIPQSEVDTYYAASDVFTFASVTETQGLVVNEAMRYGLPAVAVSGGGAAETIEDGVNGFATKNDATDLADHVLRVLKDDALYDALSHGALVSSREYSTEAMAGKIVEVYRRAVGQWRMEQSISERITTR